MAQKAKTKPTVLTGGLYKDVWYVAGGKSWMAKFLEDANADYLWADNNETGINWLTQITNSLAYYPTNCQIATTQFVTVTEHKLSALSNKN